VFWAATDDADFAETAGVWVATDSGADELRLTHKPPVGTPMALAPLDDAIRPLAQHLRAASGSAPHSSYLEAAVRAYTRDGNTIGGAYVDVLRELLEPLEIAVLDASHDAVVALASVMIGPPNRPGCCPVVTTTPFPFALCAKRCAAAPLAANAGESASSQSEPTSPATSRAWDRHPRASCGSAGYQSGTRPARAATDNGDPPSDSVRTSGRFMRARAPELLVIGLATDDRPGAVQLFRENEASQLVRQRPRRE